MGRRTLSNVGARSGIGCVGFHGEPVVVSGGCLVLRLLVDPDDLTGLSWSAGRLSVVVLATAASPGGTSFMADKSSDSPVRIIGSRELHQNLPGILRELENNKVRYVLTVHGRPRAVLIGAEPYL